MQSFSYPVRLAPDRRNGGYVVTFRDLPEATTQGRDLADALAQAADCLEEAMAGRIRRGDEILAPSRPAKGPAPDRPQRDRRQSSTLPGPSPNRNHCSQTRLPPALPGTSRARLLDPSTPPASPTSNAPCKPLENNWLSRSATPPETPLSSQDHPRCDPGVANG